MWLSFFLVCRHGLIGQPVYKFCQYSTCLLFIPDSRFQLCGLCDITHHVGLQGSKILAQGSKLVLCMQAFFSGLVALTLQDA